MLPTPQTLVQIRFTKTECILGILTSLIWGITVNNLSVSIPNADVGCSLFLSTRDRRPLSPPPPLTEARIKGTRNSILSSSVSVCGHDSKNNTVPSVHARCSSTAQVWLLRRLLHRKIPFPSSHNASFQHPSCTIWETCKWVIPFEQFPLPWHRNTKRPLVK